MAQQKSIRIKAWECIGCGRIEAPQPCLGICQDRAVELVHAEDYARLEKEYEHMRELVLRLARTSPREGQWEAGYKAVQQRARELVAQLETGSELEKLPE